MDPDIYSSGEVAWQYQSSLYSKVSQKNIYNLFRDNEINWYFKPGTTNLGFVYTHLKLGTKAVLVRLFAEKKVKEFAFFVEVPKRWPKSVLWKVSGKQLRKIRAIT